MLCGQTQWRRRRRRRSYSLELYGMFLLWWLRYCIIMCTWPIMDMAYAKTQLGSVNE